MVVGKASTSHSHLHLVPYYHCEVQGWGPAWCRHNRQLIDDNFETGPQTAMEDGNGAGWRTIAGDLYD
ncbi:hypothetical protein N7453_007755 [Penicillium expansum]|nr:hypothetical protein N7453_007755 [Penicillium expansum]